MKPKQNENFITEDAHALIIVMAKLPAPGKVKTRLMPLLSSTQAAQIACAFLCDTLKASHQVASNVMLAYAPQDSEKRLREILPLDLQPAPHLWIAQRGQGLGARLENAAADGFALGFAMVFIIGADSPTLPHTFLKSAIVALKKNSNDIVLGPTEDGGFYLLGLKAMQRNLYQNVTWSTPGVLAQIVTNAENLNLHLKHLPKWHDVDTPADLQKLKHHFQQNETARINSPNTFAWMKENNFLFQQ